MSNKRERAMDTDENSQNTRAKIESSIVVPSSGSLNRTPAKEYKFKLDTFQQQAVDYIEAGESVLVAAHTSAGKTAVAEYAIAKSLRDKQRVIYTSPIKALSNQKYRDLQEEFGDVGLMTGDMTINPSATCLIMTTEILRSMLYKGSEMMREVAWVIYDEVHYMRDKERGVVWEESIILLPHKVRFVFLSATIPNANEFVSWVAKLHHQPCHVVYTDYRPVPLQHFVFPAGAEGLFLVVDEKAKFREENFQKAMACLQSETAEGSAAGAAGGNGGGGGDKRKKGGGGPKNNNSDLLKIVKLIMERALDPCIIFSFSKKECETYALQMARMDFNSADDKLLVEQVFTNAMEALSENDRNLPQVVTILPLLKNGVGIHHGGLLPILKEVIEILFQEGLIKCLFATETFSIGINMPAKTVVFTSTRKFDGKDFRWITSGEYIQMSGRAGRRGKDDRGIVIQMLDEKMEPDVVKNMIYGASDPLFSSYNVGYNMVLNMLRVEDANPENLIRSSFHQYQQEMAAPKFEKLATELEAEASALEIAEEEVVAEQRRMMTELRQVERDLSAIVMARQYSLPFLQEGRMLYVRTAEADWGWGMLIRVHKQGGPNNSKGSYIGPTQQTQLLSVLLAAVPAEAPHPTSGLNYQAVTDGTIAASRPEILEVDLTAVKCLSAVRLTVPKDVISSEAKKNGVLKAIRDVCRRFSTETSGVPPLDPVKDMGVPADDVRDLLARQKELGAKLAASSFHQLEDRETLLLMYDTKQALLEQSKGNRRKATENLSVVMRDQLKRMKAVLKVFEYISPEGVLQVKGKFMCELSAADELVLTNLVFDGAFNNFTIDQTVALLSCFVHKEAAKEKSGKIRGDMQAPFRQLQAAARNVARVSIDCKMNLDEEEYVASFNPGLIDVTHAWCTGAEFVEVCKLTEVFEGSIVRVLRRLEELLRQLASAALAIGNAELMQMFEEGSKRLRRGKIIYQALEAVVDSTFQRHLGVLMSTVAGIPLHEQFDDREYYQAYLKNGIRPDGRAFGDYRPMTIRTGVISAPNVYGSSQVQVGKTVVLCGVNIMVGTPSMANPDQGDLECDVTLSAMVDVAYDQRNKHDDATNAETAVLDSLVQGKMINLEQLSIVKGKFAFRLCLNIVCLSNGGNLVDASVLAATYALRDVKLPEPVVVKDVVEVNPENSTRLEVASACIPVTVGLLNGVYLVDPSQDESRLLTGSVTVVVDTTDGSLRYLKQGDNRGLAVAQLREIIALATQVALRNSAALQK